MINRFVGTFLGFSCWICDVFSPPFHLSAMFFKWLNAGNPFVVQDGGNLLSRFVSGNVLTKINTTQDMDRDEVRLS